MAPTTLEICIRPGIPPHARHQIEDTLASKGFEVLGGGGFDDGSESDITIEVEDLDSDLPVVRRVLQKARVGRDSVVIEGSPNDVRHAVYPHGEVPPTKPWWQFW